MTVAGRTNLCFGTTIQKSAFSCFPPVRAPIYKVSSGSTFLLAHQSSAVRPYTCLRLQFDQPHDFAAGRAGARAPSEGDHCGELDDKPRAAGFPTSGYRISLEGRNCPRRPSVRLPWARSAAVLPSSPRPPGCRCRS
jgi:hypothetical protein